MMAPLRLAYVLNAFPKVSETFVAHELAELRRRSVEVCILAARYEPGPVHRVVTAAGLDTCTTYDTEAFGRVIQDFRPHLIHAHFATGATARARDLAARARVPFTFTAHGYDIYREPPDDFAARVDAAAGFATVSEANARYIASTFGVPEASMAVIPNGVEPHVFRPDPAAPRQAGAPPILLCVARLEPVKNHELLLEACAELCARQVAFRCVLVGEGRRRSLIERRREALGLQDVVTLVGARPHEDVRAWMQRSTVAVLTSHSEGLPVSLLEAAACGLPVVATRVGGVPEIVHDGITGLLCPPDDRHAVASAIADLLADPAGGAAMGRRGREMVVARHTLTQQVDTLLGFWGAIPGLAAIVGTHRVKVA